MRCGVGSAGLNPRLFSCKYVLLTIWAHVRTYGVGLGVGVDGRGNPETREGSGRVCEFVKGGRLAPGLSYEVGVLVVVLRNMRALAGVGVWRSETPSNEGWGQYMRDGAGVGGGGVLFFLGGGQRLF